MSICFKSQLIYQSRKIVQKMYCLVLAHFFLVNGALNLICVVTHLLFIAGSVHRVHALGQRMWGHLAHLVIHLGWWHWSRHADGAGTGNCDGWCRRICEGNWRVERVSLLLLLLLLLPGRRRNDLSYNSH